MADKTHNLYAAGISHETVSSEFLGRFGIPAAECTKAEESALAIEGISELSILSTCNRVEVYFAADSVAAADKILQALYNERAGDFRKVCRIVKNAEAICHIFAVGSGLKSQMTGETEILGQLKAAYERSQAAGHCGAILNPLFQKAIHCAKWVRTNTEIGRGKISVGSVCAELASRIFEDITKAKILLAGSGEVGKLVAEALYVRGANNILVCSRKRANADALAAKIGCVSGELKTSLEQLENFDIVLCASLSEKPLINKELVKKACEKRCNRPIFLIDLAVPHNIENDCADIDDAFLYNLSDLSKIANENIATRKAEITLAKTAVETRANALAKRLFGVC